MKTQDVTVAGGRVLGFFSLLLLLTLNASNGRDVLDELVPWIAAQTEATLNESRTR